MTRDETLTAEEVEGKDRLKKEAEEYFKNICQDYNEEYERTGKRHYFVGFDIKNAYLASAEPREKRIEELEEAKANFEYLLEGKDNEIDELKKENKVLAQNLEDTEICENGWKNRVRELEVQIEKMKCYLPVDERDSDHKWFAYKNLFDTKWKIDYSVQGELPKCNTIKWFENKEAVMFYLVSNGMKYYEEPRR